MFIPMVLALSVGIADSQGLYHYESALREPWIVFLVQSAQKLKIAVDKSTRLFHNIENKQG